MDYPFGKTWPGELNGLPLWKNMAWRIEWNQEISEGDTLDKFGGAALRISQQGFFASSLVLLVRDTSKSCSSTWLANS